MLVRGKCYCLKTLLPNSINKLGVKGFTNMREGLTHAIVMMLRLQNERMTDILP